MKKKLLVIITAILCISSNIIGQEALNLPKIVPVSPNAASLGIYGSIPVGYYTGVPNISIPIYEIDLDGKKFPISFSYHASGIKVAQEASTVGLGWVLNAGGCITKEVRGWDDFQTAPMGYYFDTDMPMPDSNNDKDMSLPKNTISQYTLYAGNILDSEPDLFHFNFGSFSGTCFFRKIGANGNSKISANAVIRNGKDFLKIQYFFGSASFNAEDYWIITDVDGFKYHFHTNERSEIYSSTACTTIRSSFKRRPCQDILTTSWSLDSIVSPLNNKIVFTYEKDFIYTHATYSENIYKLIDFQSDYYNNEGGLLTINDCSYPSTYSKNEQVLLKEISLPGGTIAIGYSNRDDIESVTTTSKARKIDNITIQNNHDEIGKIALKQSYMGYPSLDSTQKRLILDSLIVNDKRYAFTYDNSWFGLPEKDNAHADYWGYYNKSDVSNTTEFRLAPPAIVNYENGYRYFTGKNNQSNEESMKIGNLTSIQYPTGGKTVFDYEMHDFSNPFYTVEEKAIGSHHYYYDADNPEDSNTAEYGNDFDVTQETMKGKIKIVYSCLSNKTYQNNDGVTIVPAIVSVERKTGNYYALFKQYNIECRSDGDKTDYNYFDFPSSGTYRIRVSITGSLQPDISILINSPVYKQISSGGGLRIKSITDYTNESNFIKHEYFYKKNGYTSGLLMNKPQNTIVIAGKMELLAFNSKKFFPIIDSLKITGVFACSHPLMPFSNSASGEAVGYSFVEELVTKSDTSNGKTSYTFSNMTDSMVNISDRIILGYPSIPHLNNGSLLEVTHSDSQNKIVKRELFEYCKVASDSIKGLIAYQPHIFSEDPVVFIKYYDLYSERWVLTKKNDLILLDDKWANSTTEYQYDDLNWLIDNKKTYDSFNNIIENRIMYPHDNNTEPYISMVNKNILSPVIETTNYKNNHFLQKTRTDYKNWGNNLFAPQFVKYQANLQIVPEPRITYYKYDSKGNPLYVTKDDATKIVYLWSYNFQYLVAKIEGLTYDEVENTLNINIANNYISTLAQNALPTVAQIASIRSGLASKNALVTTYTYRPLIGIVTATDPRGVTINYTYDTFSRLTNVKNDDGNILKAYNYHYKK